MREKEKTKETLLRMRSQVKLVERLRERVGAESASGVRAISHDGMPRRTGAYSGLDARMIMREEAERILMQEEARLLKMERKARLAMADMPSGLYAFCAVYYIGGMSLTDAARVLDRSRRQCLRYKKEIEDLCPVMSPECHLDVT